MEHPMHSRSQCNSPWSTSTKLGHATGLNSAAPLISNRTSCIREDKQDLGIYFGCSMLPCRSDQQQSINLSFESKFIR